MPPIFIVTDDIRASGRFALDKWADNTINFTDQRIDWDVGLAVRSEIANGILQPAVVSSRWHAGGVRSVVIARTVGIFLALAVLSFVLGFFVLAKLVPGSAHVNTASALPSNESLSPISPETGVPADSARGAVADPKNHGADSHSAAVARVKRPKMGPGPSLDPEDPPAPAKSAGIQAPRKVGSDGAMQTTESAAKDEPAAADSSDDAKTTPKQTVRTRHRRHAAAQRKAKSSEGSDASSDGSDENTSAASEVAAVKPRRSHRVSAPPQENNDDGEANAAEPERSGPNRREESARGGTLYHVRLGAFHSREAADNEVERAKAKGFPTKVVPITHNGRTLYRVQAGAFRNRSRAEAIKQDLQDASLDASISEQRR